MTYFPFLCIYFVLFFCSGLLIVMQFFGLWPPSATFSVGVDQVPNPEHLTLSCLSGLFSQGTFSLILVLIGISQHWMAGVTERFVCTDSSSVYSCVKNSYLENVCFIDCQDNFDVLQLLAFDLLS